MSPTGGTIPIGRIADIPVRIRPLWFAALALFTVVLGGSYFPGVLDGGSVAGGYALGLAATLLIFACIVAHEFGHALVARRRGVVIEEIDLWLLGGIARMRNEPRSASDELRIALAGPAVSLSLAAVFAGLAAVEPWGPGSAIHELLAYEAFVNGLIGAFNLLPAYPMDGGRVAHALIWSRRHDELTATLLSSRIGQAFGYLLAGLGALTLMAGGLGGAWLLMIGIFVLGAARAEANRAVLERALSGRKVESFMSPPAKVIPGELSLDQAARDYFTPYGFGGFPVRCRDGSVGLLTLQVVRRTPPAVRAKTPVSRVADFDPALRVTPGSDVVALAESPAFQRAGRAVVERPDGELAIVSATDLVRALRIADLSHGEPSEHLRAA